MVSKEESIFNLIGGLILVTIILFIVIRCYYYKHIRRADRVTPEQKNENDQKPDGVHGIV